MKNPVWAKVIKQSADPGRVKQFLEQLKATEAGPLLEDCSAEQARIIATLLSGSRHLGEVLVAHPDWLSLIEAEGIRHPRRYQGFLGEVQKWLKPALATRDFIGALAHLRRFKQREMLRIAARDLARLSNAVEITREISDVADVCLDTVWEICRAQLTARFGRPYHQDNEGRWQPTAFCVMGMGKLGGQELNYSSDVDVLFVYSEEGQVFKETPTAKKLPRSPLSNHQFFNRLAESFIAEVSRSAEEGMLFRIDLRLRPEGDAGPLCRSLESYENYYAQWGQTWERMMLIKARQAAGDRMLADEFLEMIQPFRYPRFINPGVLREVAAIKRRIEKEIVGGEALERNVKLGRGGIREIEFVVQSLQLLHAGKQPFLQGTQTLPTLAKLAQYELISDEDAMRLDLAYQFLRDVEHRLQMEANLQTHTIPTDEAARQRLARLMGFDSPASFEPALRAHTDDVRRVYDRWFSGGDGEPASTLPRGFEGQETEWKKLLTEHSFRDPDTAFRLLKEFAEGPGYVHVSTHTTELAMVLIPKLLGFCPGPHRAADDKLPVLSDPDRVVSRLDSFITAYGTRASLFELWNSNPQFFELLLLLFDRSEFLAEVAIRTPDLVDHLVFNGHLRLQKTAAEILKDLRHGKADKDQFAWLRRYHAAEWMRLGLRDILGLVNFEQNLVELSALADACLQYALEAVMRRNRIKRAPFAIIGLGKLGGNEINYGSDLDVIFVTGARPKDLPKLQRLAAETMELMSKRTARGMVFQTDARLRPDGEKGLLVNTLDGYADYYRQRAQLWEIQALTRARPVAGDVEVGEQFQRLATGLADFSSATISCSRPACYTPAWKKTIHEMRMRIEKERTPVGQDDLAIKTGRGGLMDVEFIAQALCLEHGWPEPNTLNALVKGQAAGVLPDAPGLIENYRHLRRVESILRRWNYEGETVLPTEPEPYYRVSVRCGFTTSDAFRDSLAKWRRIIRAAYRKMFPFRTIH